MEEQFYSIREHDTLHGEKNLHIFYEERDENTKQLHPINKNFCKDVRISLDTTVNYRNRLDKYIIRNEIISNKKLCEHCLLYAKLLI